MHLWVVAVTWPRYERRVARALARYGFDFYLPRYKTSHQRVALLFPRYIFAGPVEQWARSFHHVTKFISRFLAMASTAALLVINSRHSVAGLNDPTCSIESLAGSSRITLR